MPVVLLQSLQTGQQIYFMNFQNPADVRGNAQKWRLIGQRLQIALVNQLRASNGLPIVWTGDMNAKKQVFCRVTQQAGMVSASGGYRSATTCQPPSGMVVDWIFGSQRAVLELRPGPEQEGRPHHRPPHAQLTDVAGPAGRPTIPPPPTPTTHHADPDPELRRSRRSRSRRAPRSRPATRPRRDPGHGALR